MYYIEGIPLEITNECRQTFSTKTYNTKEKYKNRYMVAAAFLRFEPEPLEDPSPGDVDEVVSLVHGDFKEDNLHGARDIDHPNCIP